MTEKPNATENMQITEIGVFEGLPPAAQRALKEAEARRAAEKEAQAPREIGGRGGKDPARFGDWEIKGRTIDF
ncbi:DUF1674 domain-containing protein [Falsochrobactrum sp. TDYN1]|uniref:DUF1674 domain-containing protein n=1 Tax=Falsochrobactrum tianjinense TaxID=2706015 RepID=A0A949UW85_9HYPH|nr:DUF1674 domain-containing protein [Falsochrobactrum sp. TDYN1]MBV2144808.1 DUF1674 domain-containing protein [Falsochrobactrum sp. TDYN1]